MKRKKEWEGKIKKEKIRNPVLWWERGECYIMFRAWGSRNSGSGEYGILGNYVLGLGKGGGLKLERGLGLVEKSCSITIMVQKGNKQRKKRRRWVYANEKQETTQ